MNFWTKNLVTFLLLPLNAVAMVWEPRSSYESDASLQLGRHHPITFANETHGFVLGGSTPSFDVANDFYQYEEASDTWTLLAPPPANFTERSYGYGIVLNEANHTKAYLGFGAGTAAYLSDLWEFDMATYEWRQLASLPGLGRRHPSMVPVYSNNSWKIHVGLGDGYIGDIFTNLNDYWSYDITANTWEQLPDFPSSQRHHPFFFGMGSTSYTGLGHSDGKIERDFFSFDTGIGNWTREMDFASYTVNGTLVTTEARVAGTQFSIVFPLVGSSDTNNLQGALGFVLSGDGDDHSVMNTGEFHVFDPSTGFWRELQPHPGYSRWAPGSFVMRGTARVYFTSGYDRLTGGLYSDVWMIDLSELFQADWLHVQSQETSIGSSGDNQSVTTKTPSNSGSVLGTGSTAKPSTSGGQNPDSSEGPNLSSLTSSAADLRGMFVFLASFAVAMIAW
jgi:N-acetylneuraminic acid mutarotase